MIKIKIMDIVIQNNNIYQMFEPYIINICHMIYRICHSLVWHIWHWSDMYCICTITAELNSKNKKKVLMHIKHAEVQ